MADVEHASLTGSALHEPKGVASASAGQVYIADGLGSGTWTTPTANTPVGAMMDYAGATAPSGWLLCYGQAVSRTTYSALFAAIGTTHGAGNGSTTFNLPDCRGRAVFGKENMGGSSAGRLTSFTATSLGNSSGSETVTLTQGNIPSYQLSSSYSATTAVVGTNISRNVGSSLSGSLNSGVQKFITTDDVGASITLSTTVTGTVNSAGSDIPFNIFPFVIPTYNEVRGQREEDTTSDNEGPILDGRVGNCNCCTTCDRGLRSDMADRILHGLFLGENCISLGSPTFAGIQVRNTRTQVLEHEGFNSSVY